MKCPKCKCNVTPYNTFLKPCACCGKSTNHTDGKNVVFMYVKKGVRGINDRREWRTKKEYYMCLKCFYKLLREK